MKISIILKNLLNLFLAKFVLLASKFKVGNSFYSLRQSNFESLNFCWKCIITYNSPCSLFLSEHHVLNFNYFMTNRYFISKSSELIFCVEENENFFRFLPRKIRAGTTEHLPFFNISGQSPWSHFQWSLGAFVHHDVWNCWPDIQHGSLYRDHANGVEAFERSWKKLETRIQSFGPSGIFD